MGKRTDIRKIMVIGSGPIIIGQAAEFDYAGTQACIALKEEGYEVVLINSNPATIMTDKEIADKVYIEPITLEFVSKILREELPDAILPSLGGQTGLNMAIELDKSGILKELGIELIGTDLEAIDKAEDRDLFRELMNEMGEPVPKSTIVHSVEEAVEFANEAGYPIIVRPAFTLGGTGGGICEDEKEMKAIVENGLSLSPVNQCLIEISIAGFKEVEYEVMRDTNNDALVICSMENFDPVGIHTGDSIVFAPYQSLSEEANAMLEKVSLRIIRALGIKGGCNVQLALHPKTLEYYVIEVNPRVSRSSALASKATGFPIARVSAKIAVGLNFSEMYNEQTDSTFDQYDAKNINYTVAKIPRWSSDKFKGSDRLLGTQMKATGEVMAIGQSIEESLLKAVRSLEIGASHIWKEEAVFADDDALEEELVHAKDDRLFYIAEAIRRGYSLEKLYDLTKITPLFLEALVRIIKTEEKLVQKPKQAEVLKEAKELGFSDEAVGHFWDLEGLEVTSFRKGQNLNPSYLPVTIWDTGEKSNLPYYYSSYHGENTSRRTGRKSILVLGSGPIRIGQGIEFDYATVHSVKALQDAGYEAIIMNSNPETVSTDFSISDKLYFEPLTLEDVLEVIEIEKPEGVIVQFGGQTAINLAEPLEKQGIRILGTSVEDLNRAEDRDKFEKALRNLDIKQPEGNTAFTIEKALTIPEQIGGYPVLVRPSYVLGGRGMEIVDNDKDLTSYMEESIKNSNSDHPTLIDHYVVGTEVEVDAVSDGETVIIPGIMEHIEASGVHSGDSMAVYPPQTLSSHVQDKIVDYTIRLCQELNSYGLMNIQFVVEDEEVYVIEVNPRASRTVPFLSKVTDIPMAQVATKAILGQSLKEQGFKTGLYPVVDTVHVKAPVFSFNKLNEADPMLGPEMKSTGEVMGSNDVFENALYKAFVGSGMKVKDGGTVLFTVREEEFDDCVSLAERMFAAGFKIAADKEFAEVLESRGIKVSSLEDETEEAAVQLIRAKAAHLVVNTQGRIAQKRGYGKKARIAAAALNLPLFTSLDTFKAFVSAVEARNKA